MTFIQTFAAATGGKIAVPNDIAAPSKLPVPKAPKQSAAEKSARKKASKALANARQRCSNPKNPDYANYGAVGIKVMFAGVAQLIADIGLPSAVQSLDRIDPNAHYQVGNVRWASAAVQAANKKASSAAAHFSTMAQIINAQEAMGQYKARMHVTKSWGMILRAYQRGYFAEEEVSFLAGTLTCPGVLEANFDLDTIPDMANHHPGYLHLPSLSLPGSRIRLRSGPIDPAQMNKRLHDYGRLAGLEKLEPEYNVPPTIWKTVIDIVSASRPGLALIGQPNTEMLLGGWMEGSMLAMAGALTGKYVKAAAFMPALTVLEALSDIGSRASWAEVYHPVLDSEVLLIPDFCLDCGTWGMLPNNRWWKIGELLEYRYESQLQTVVGVQNVSKLPSSIRDIVLGAYTVQNMPKTVPHDLHPLEFAGEYRSIPASGSTLRGLLGSDLTKKLVWPTGLLAA